MFGKAIFAFEVEVGLGQLVLADGAGEVVAGGGMLATGQTEAGVKEGQKVFEQLPGSYHELKIADWQRKKKRLPWLSPDRRIKTKRKTNFKQVSFSRFRELFIYLVAALTSFSSSLSYTNLTIQKPGMLSKKC